LGHRAAPGTGRRGFGEPRASAKAPQAGGDETRTTAGRREEARCQKKILSAPQTHSQAGAQTFSPPLTATRARHREQARNFWFARLCYNEHSRRARTECNSAS
jgi:hypothetical protein